MPQQTPYHDDDFELTPFEEELRHPDEFLDDPDEPLPAPANHQTPFTTPRRRPWTIYQRMESLRPKWLQPSPSWTKSLLDKFLVLIRPRFTVGYVLCSIVFLYVVYCTFSSSPLFASKLPKYTGPYDVGAIDIEVPVREPRKVGDAVFKADGNEVFQLDTVLFTLYYPAAKGVRSTKPKHKWFPKPIGIIAEGYAKAARFNNFFSRGLFATVLWGLAGSIEIPAEVDVPLLQDKKLKEMPVVVLSHGDVSSRTDYTAFSGELASRGVVVATMEHRDGSCPGSVVHLPEGKKKNVLLFRADELEPKDGEKEVPNDDWRFQKLAFRDAEVQEAISVLQSINDGKGNEAYEQNYRNEGHDLPSFEGRLNFSQVVIAGHSFGATGALQALKSANRTTSASDSFINPAIGGLILDPGKSSGRLNTDISVPLLIVHSDSWSKAHTLFYGRPHFDTVKDIAADVLSRVGASWFMTSLKTSHPSITDAPLIEPLLLSWTTGATIDVKEGLREYVRVSMEFLEFLGSGKREGVLDVGVTHQEYGNDTRSDEQKKKMEKGITKYWEVHVAPPADFESEKDR